MERLEVAQLTDLIEAMCPAQKIGAQTAAAWHPLLVHVPLADALLAVRELGMRQSFISPADVIDTVRRIRADRLTGVDDLIDALGGYPGDPDDVTGEIAWRRSVIAAVADGHQPTAERRAAAAIEAASVDPAAGAARVRAVVEEVRAQSAAAARARAEEAARRRQIDEVERARQLRAVADLPEEPAS